MATERHGRTQKEDFAAQDYPAKCDAHYNGKAMLAGINPISAKLF
jgi:hypothetical protein